MGSIHKSKLPIFEKLKFLDGMSLDSLQIENNTLETREIFDEDTSESQILEEQVAAEQQVITDNQEYYEVCNLYICQHTHTDTLSYIYIY